MEYAVDPLAGGSHRVAVLDVAADHLDAHRFQFRIRTSPKAAHAVAAFDKLLDNISAEESSPAGD